MSKDTRSIPAAFRGYLLPRSAHDSLIHTRDQLRLLAQFTQARSESPEYIVIPPDALSELFERAATYVDDALSVAVCESPEPVVYEEQGKIRFRFEKYVYSHSVISFLESTRDIDTKDVQLLDVLVGGEERHWSIAHKNQPQTGMRLRKTTSICYGVAPAGFVTTDGAEPLVAGGIPF